MEKYKVPDELCQIAEFDQEKGGELLINEPILQFTTAVHYEDDRLGCNLNFIRVAYRSSSNIMKRMFGIEREVPLIVTFNFVYN